MRKEVSSAVDFITKFLRSSGKLNDDHLDIFNVSLTRLLCEKYNNHWFPEKPFKGSGYRCLRINHKMEPLITKAAVGSGLTEEQLITFLPNELTMWIDPQEVSYRIGEDGSVGMIYNAEREGHHETQSSPNTSGRNSMSSPRNSMSSPTPSPRYSPAFGSPNGSVGSSPRCSPEPFHRHQQELVRSHSPSTSEPHHYPHYHHHQPHYFQTPKSCKGQMNSHFKHTNESINLQRLAAYVYS